MEFTIGTILSGLLYSIVVISFFTIFPVALGAAYLWFILKMFHRNNIGFWRLIGTSLFSYFFIIISGIFLTFLFSPMMMTSDINRIETVFSYYYIILITFSGIMGIFAGTLCIRKLLKESWGYSLFIAFLVILLTSATFYLIQWSPVGNFILPRSES